MAPASQLQPPDLHVRASPYVRPRTGGRVGGCECGRALEGVGKSEGVGVRKSEVDGMRGRGRGSVAHIAHDAPFAHVVQAASVHRRTTHGHILRAHCARVGVSVCCCARACRQVFMQHSPLLGPGDRRAMNEDGDSKVGRIGTQSWQLAHSMEPLIQRISRGTAIGGGLRMERTIYSKPCSPLI